MFGGVNREWGDHTVMKPEPHGSLRPAARLYLLFTSQRASARGPTASQHSSTSTLLCIRTVSGLNGSRTQSPSEPAASPSQYLSPSLYLCISISLFLSLILSPSFLCISFHLPSPHSIPISLSLCFTTLYLSLSLSLSVSVSVSIGCGDYRGDSEQSLVYHGRFTTLQLQSLKRTPLLIRYTAALIHNRQNSLHIPVTAEYVQLLVYLSLAVELQYSGPVFPTIGVQGYCSGVAGRYDGRKN